MQMFHALYVRQEYKYEKQNVEKIIIFVKITQQVAIIFHGISLKREKFGHQNQ